MKDSVLNCSGIGTLKDQINTTIPVDNFIFVIAVIKQHNVGQHKSWIRVINLMVIPRDRPSDGPEKKNCCILI